MENKEISVDRILVRKMARALTKEEMELIGGGVGQNRMAGVTNSTCSSSDNNACDLDTDNDVGTDTGTQCDMM